MSGLRWHSWFFGCRSHQSVAAAFFAEFNLNAYESMADARQSLKKYFELYNQSRKHQTLKATPDRVYYESISLPEVA